MKIFIVCINLLFLICSISYASELKHIIHDVDVYGPDNWENTKCIDGSYNHLFINLSYEDWLKICGATSGNSKNYFQADFCIRCRLIPVRCNGNDWFRYEI